jgi:predicted alpha/beta-hydrolase family hydrolase
MRLRKISVSVYALNYSAVSCDFRIVEFNNAQHDLEPFKRAALSRAQPIELALRL